MTDEIDFKIGTEEQSFLEDELKANEHAIEVSKKAIEAAGWMCIIIKKRIKEIENEGIE